MRTVGFRVTDVQFGFQQTILRGQNANLTPRSQEGAKPVMLIREKLQVEQPLPRHWIAVMGKGSLHFR
jgi:hypothetical protein